VSSTFARSFAGPTGAEASPSPGTGEGLRSKAQGEGAAAADPDEGPSSVDIPRSGRLNYPMEPPNRTTTPAVSSRKGSGDRRASRIQEAR